MVENRCSRIDWDETFWVLIQSGAEMKRDDDYLRETLFKLEADEEWFYTFTGETDDEERELYHLILLSDAGLLERYGSQRLTFRLKNAGHDFIAMTRDDGAWGKVRVASTKVGGASVQMLYRIAEVYARQKLAEMGVPLA